MQRTRRGLKSSIGILSGDTNGDDVTLRPRLTLKLRSFGIHHVKVNFRCAIRGNTIQLTDVSDSVKRNTHGNLKLGSGKVDARNHLGGRMLDLKARVELEEIEYILCMTVEVCRNSELDTKVV